VWKISPPPGFDPRRREAVGTKIAVELFLHSLYFLMSWYLIQYIFLIAALVDVILNGTVRSDSRFALRLRYVDLVVSIEVAFEVCCFFTIYSC
jgi:hypothetical protein